MLGTLAASGRCHARAGKRRSLPSGFADRVAVAVAAESSMAQRGDSPSALGALGRRCGARGIRRGHRNVPRAAVAGCQRPDGACADDASRSRKPRARREPASPASPAPGVPDRAAQLATAVAVADAPRKVLARRSRGQSQRAALRAGTRATADAPIAVAANSAPAANATAVDPFSGQTVSLPDRPWPRAMLPGSPASGAFTVDYGNRVGNDAALHPFYPFVPRAATAGARGSRPTPMSGRRVDGRAAVAPRLPPDPRFQSKPR